MMLTSRGLSAGVQVARCCRCHQPAKGYAFLGDERVCRPVPDREDVDCSTGILS